MKLHIDDLPVPEAASTVYLPGRKNERRLSHTSLCSMAESPLTARNTAGSVFSNVMLFILCINYSTESTMATLTGS